MKRSKKVLVSIALFSILLVSTGTARAGIIVGLAGEKPQTQMCEELKGEGSVTTKVNHGIIVGFTGIIVGLTGIIVGFVDTKSECGFIPTSD